MKTIWCISDTTTINRMLNITGFESRRMAYREAEKRGKQVIKCNLIEKKFIRPAQPVPKKNVRYRGQKKRK